MHALRWIALLVCIIAGFSRAGAAQQQDPRHDYRLPQFSTDARLRQPVTCTALGTPLTDLLKRLQANGSLFARQPAGSTVASGGACGEPAAGGADGIACRRV